MQLSWKKNHCVIFMQYAFLLLRYTNTVYIFLVITKSKLKKEKCRKGSNGQMKNLVYKR